MRSSSVRTVTLVLAAFALAPAVITGMGCGPTSEQVAPTKLEQKTPFERGTAEKRERDPNDPFRNPATEAPEGREGAQLSEEELDATLAEAAEFAKVENVAQEREVLSKCANKTPASGRCDGRMGLSLIKSKNRRATALYYLSEAAQIDDPKADAAMYAAIGDALGTHGRFDLAIAAMDKAIARDASAETLYAFGRLLSLTPERLPDSAARIAEARSKDDRIEWLYEEAVIRGQIPVREQAEQALALFKEYKTRAESVPVETLPAVPASLEPRIAELELLRQRYPTQAEYDKQQAAGGGEPKPAPAEPKPEQQPT